MIRVLLVDDHPVVRAGCRKLLEMEGILVIAEASEVDGAYRSFCETHPDVTVLDLSLPGPSGMELLRRIRARSRASPVVVFSMFDPVLGERRARDGEANGFVAKDSAPEDLVAAIHAVGSGGSWWRGDRSSAWEQNELDRLSRREVEVLTMLARGFSASACAELLHVSVKTVANYQSAIREKLRIDCGAGLVHFALRHGLLSGRSECSVSDPIEASSTGKFPKTVPVIGG
jgi:two-component system invasion response regulator UvrY